jgi:S1-C subfamily serine protease
MKYAPLKNRNPDHLAPPLIYVLRGRIEFVGMVRGKEDSIYYKFLKELDSLIPGFVRVPILRSELDALFEYLFLVETQETQGTGFLLKGIGLVTAAHVLDGGTGLINTRSHDGVQREARIVAKDNVLDLAILDIGFETGVGLELSSVEVKPRAAILLLGFPNHNVDDSAQVREGHVSGTRKDPTSNERLILIDASIIYGNSGGPVLDSSNRVIGIALRGATNEAEAQRTEFHAAMPVSAILRLVRT